MYLLDTNILLRLAQPGHVMHQEAKMAVHSLLRQKKIICIVPQVIFEFWVVATRPIANNGLGLSIEDAKQKTNKIESFFPLRLDLQVTCHEWWRLIETYSVSGVNAHDARLVAAMKVNGLSHLLTFNLEDFKRYNNSEIIVVSPAQVISSAISST